MTTLSVAARPPCPFLPIPVPDMSYRDLARHRGAGKAGTIDAEGLFLDALCYGHYLWLQGYSARALLALMRALYVDTDRDFPITGSWVLPYAAIGWMVSNHPGDSFLGNPRISFQHQATRGVALRYARRQARAWAAWAVVCKSGATLQPDLSYEFLEPGLDEIRALLERHGLPDEAALWERALKSEI